MSFVQEWKTYRYGWVWSTWHRYAQSLLLVPKHVFRQWNQIQCFPTVEPDTMLLAPALRRTGTYGPDPSVSTASTAAGTSSSSSCTHPCHSWHRTRATWWPSSLTLCTPWLAGSPFLMWAHEGRVRLPQTSVLRHSAAGAAHMAPCTALAAWPVLSCLPVGGCLQFSASTHQQPLSGGASNPQQQQWPRGHNRADGSKLDLRGTLMGQKSSTLSSHSVCSMCSLHVHRNRYSDLFETTSSAELLMYLMLAGVPGGLTAGIADVFFRLPIIKHNYAWSGSVSAGLTPPPSLPNETAVMRV